MRVKTASAFRKESINYSLLAKKSDLSIWLRSTFEIMFLMIQAVSGDTIWNLQIFRGIEVDLM